MATLMVDTDVYSYITSSNLKWGAPYKPHLQGHTIVLSFITVGEQYFGYCKKIKQGGWPASYIQKLESRLAQVVIVPYDSEVCKTYGELKANLLKSVALNDRLSARIRKSVHSTRLS